MVQIARLQGDASVAQLVSRIYGLPANSSQLAAATAALQAANPHLADGIGKLPSGTPLVVPPVSGLAAAAGTTTPEPRVAALLGTLQTVAGQVQAQITAAPAPTVPGTAPAPVSTPLQITAADLQALTGDIAALGKQLGG